MYIDVVVKPCYVVCMLGYLCLYPMFSRVEVTRRHCLYAFPPIYLRDNLLQVAIIRATTDSHGVLRRLWPAYKISACQ